MESYTIAIKNIYYILKHNNTMYIQIVLMDKVKITVC